jgi:hypothetical protein
MFFSRRSCSRNSASGAGSFRTIDPPTPLLAWTSVLWLTITFLILIPAPGHTEWKAVENQHQSPGLRTIYFDPATIHREGDLVTMTTLTDWKWMQGNRSPSRFHSTKLTHQFDCAGKRLRRLAFTDYYGRMGTGRQVASHDSEGIWHPVEPESLNYALWEVACGKT